MSCEQLHAFVRVDTKVPSEFASWLFHTPGGVATLKSGADGVSRWKSHMEVW